MVIVMTLGGLYYLYHYFLWVSIAQVLTSSRENAKAEHKGELYTVYGNFDYDIDADDYL